MITVKYHKVDALFCKMSRRVKNWTQMQDMYTHIANTRHNFSHISRSVFHPLLKSSKWETSHLKLLPAI